MCKGVSNIKWHSKFYTCVMSLSSCSSKMFKSQENTLTHRLSCLCFRPQRSQSWQTMASHCRPTCRGWRRSRWWIWDFRMNGKTSAYPAEGQCLRRMRSGGGMDMVWLTFKTPVHFVVALDCKEILQFSNVSSVASMSFPQPQLIVHPCCVSTYKYVTVNGFVKKIICHAFLF